MDIRKATGQGTWTVFALALALSVAIGGLTWASSAQSSDQQGDLVEYAPEESEESLTTVAAEVNGESISQFTLEGALASAELEGAPTAPGEALDALIDRELLYQEALRRGLEATGDEVADAIAVNRDAVPGWAVEQAIEHSSELADDMSVDEYWEHPAVTSATSKNLTIGNLRDELRADAQTNPEAAVNDEVKKLRDSADIVIHDNVLDDLAE